MNQEQTKQFNDMIRKVDELYKFMQDKKRQQFTQPIDEMSLSVLGESFLTKYFGVFKTISLFFKTGSSTDPITEGQMNYNETSKVLKVMLNGTVKTITTS